MTGICFANCCRACALLLSVLVLLFLFYCINLLSVIEHFECQSSDFSKAVIIAVASHHSFCWTGLNLCFNIIIISSSSCNWNKTEVKQFCFSFISDDILLFQFVSVLHTCETKYWNIAKVRGSRLPICGPRLSAEAEKNVDDELLY